MSKDNYDDRASMFPVRISDARIADAIAEELSIAEERKITRVEVFTRAIRAYDKALAKIRKRKESQSGG